VRTTSALYQNGLYPVPASQVLEPLDTRRVVAYLGGHISNAGRRIVYYTVSKHAHEQRHRLHSQGLFCWTVCLYITPFAGSLVEGIWQ
jgi:hypothetical protein